MLQRGLLIATVAAALVSPLAAQNFASAMTVGDREVFIGQPQNDYLPGMVYVYRPDAKGVWREAAKLVAADAAPSDGFGRGLAVDGPPPRVRRCGPREQRGAAHGHPAPVPVARAGRGRRHAARGVHSG